MDDVDYILDTGFMFGVYESGPWLGAKFQENPSMGWIGGGTESYNFGVKSRLFFIPFTIKRKNKKLSITIVEYSICRFGGIVVYL